jgi:hypothetical protein
MAPPAGSGGDAVGSGERWLMAEAWWAPEVTPPRFRDFITWVLPMFPWLAAGYAVAAGQRIYRPDPRPASTAAGRARWSAGQAPLPRWLEHVDLQLFAGLLTAAVTVAFSAMAPGWLWSIWDRHAIAGFLQRHRIEKGRRPGAVTTVLQLAPDGGVLRAGGVTAGRDGCGRSASTGAEA